jgi:WD40 repeat protein
MNQAGVIRLWGMQTGKEKRPLDAIPDGLKAVCWADAKTILTVGGDLIVRNWDAATGKRLGSPRALQRKQQYPMFAAGGKLLVTSFTQDDDSILVRVYDPSNGKLILEQPGYWAAFSPNGKRAATGGNNESIRIIDVDTGKRIHTIAPEAEENTSKPPFAHPLGFTSDGRSLVVLSAAAESKTLSTWDVLTGDQKSSWDLMKKELLKNPAERHKYSMEGIQAVAVSPNGNTVAFSLLKDGPTDRHGNLLDPFDRIVILETTSGKILHQIDVEEGYDGYFESLSFSPDGKLLAAGGRWTLRLWNVETGKNAGKFEGHRGNVQSLAFSPDGKRLASASEDSTVLVWGVAK